MEPMAAESACPCRSECRWPVSKNKKGATREIGRASCGRVTEPLSTIQRALLRESGEERVCLYYFVLLLFFDGDEVQHGYLPQ